MSCAGVCGIQQTRCFFDSLLPTISQFLGVNFPEVNRDSKMMVDNINEGEIQFVKALTRGCGWLKLTIGGLSGQAVVPGNVERRPFNTYGFLADLTQLMSEENGLTIDLVADDKVNARAKLLLQGKRSVSGDTIGLNGHVPANQRWSTDE